MKKEKHGAFANMIIENGFFRMVYRPMDELDLEKAKKIVEERIAFKDGVSYPSLFDVREVGSISKEARDYMANEGNDLVTSSALLINSPVLKMMGNFYITVNKPIKPTQLFTSEEKAIQWLKMHSQVSV